MPTIPLPFIVSLLLFIFLIRLSGNREHAPADKASRMFVGACAMLVAVVGLRWSIDLKVVRLLQPIIAAMLPPLAWVCFTQREQASPDQKRWLHLTPVGLVTLLSVAYSLWRSPIDLVLATIFCGYGLALLRQASGGPDMLGAARFSNAAATHKAMMVAGLTLIGSGCVDLMVAIDFGFNRGTHAASIVAAANLITLIIASYLVAVAGRSRPVTEEDKATIETLPAIQQETGLKDDAADNDVVAAIDKLLREHGLFRNPDLTLDRLARRAGIPSRQISAAINRVHGRNVSQVVNEYRIAEAQRLLAETELPITAIMLECGFQTKSNFNREFRRMAGMSPSDFRHSITDTVPRNDNTVTISPTPPPESS